MPKLFFESRAYLASRYEATGDGKRFLMVRLLEEEAAAAPPITVVVNWQAAIQR